MFLCSLLLGCVLGADATDKMIVENDRVSIDLSSRGSVIKATDKKSGRVLFFTSAQRPLFRFDYSKGGDASTKAIMCHAGQAAQVHMEPWSQGSDRGAKISFSGFEGLPIQVICTVFTRENDDLVHFSLEAKLPTGVTIESISYPVVSTPLAEGVSEAAAAGTTTGGILHPSTWKMGQVRRFDQPPSLAAGFGCYYDDAGGLYTAALDGKEYRKSLILERTKRGLDFGWIHPCYHRDRFVLDYDIVLGGFTSPEKGRPTDWRDAADLYKAWAVKQPWCAKTFAQRGDLPDWIKQGPAIVRFTRAWLSEPKMIESWYRDYWQKEYPGKSPLITAYWGWEHVGKWVGPEYFPAYPSDEQFRQLVRLGRDLNAHAFLWPSGYHYSLSYGKRLDGSFLWDNRASFDASARPHTVVKRNGESEVRDCAWLRGGQHCIICPGDPWGLDWLNHSAVECAQHGAEIIQIDQACGGYFPICYSRTHNHPPGPGLWTTEAFHRQLQTMARQCRAVEPDTVLGFESPNEWYLQKIGIQDYRDCDLIWSGVEPASVFAYLYHEYVPTLFQSNRDQTGHDPWALAWCLVHGQIPHLAPRLGIGAGPMIIDGGFERFSDEGSIEFPRTMMYPGGPWSDGETQIDRVEHHSGRASLKLYNLNPKGWALAGQNYPIGETFRPGRTYRLSVWMKSRQVAKPNGLILKAFAPGMNALQAWQIPYPADQAEWGPSQVDFTMPEGTTVLRVMLILEGAGTAWLDDLKMEEVLPDGRTLEVQRPALPVDHAFMRQWITLYHGEGRPYLALGKMLHPPRLEAGAPVSAGTRRLPPVMHNAFEAPDGSQAVVLANWTANAQSVKLAWKGRIHAIELQPNEVRLVN